MSIVATALAILLAVGLVYNRNVLIGLVGLVVYYGAWIVVLVVVTVIIPAYIFGTIGQLLGGW